MTCSDPLYGPHPLPAQTGKTSYNSHMSIDAQLETEIEVTTVLETVDRAVAELRRGSAVVVTADSGSVLARPAETIDFGPLPFFNRPGLGETSVAVTGRRAAILGLAEPSAPAVILSHQDGFSPQDVRALIDPKADDQGPVPPPGVTGETADSASAAYTSVRLAH
jgi:GTP cyclohydrolase II